MNLMTLRHVEAMLRYWQAPSLGLTLLLANGFVYAAGSEGRSGENDRASWFQRGQATVNAQWGHSSSSVLQLQSGSSTEQRNHNDTTSGQFGHAWLGDRCCPGLGSCLRRACVVDSACAYTTKGNDHCKHTGSHSSCNASCQPWLTFCCRTGAH